MTDLVIVFELHVAQAGTGVGKGNRIVGKAGSYLGPVAGPAEITGIDIGRQSLFESVQLIRADGNASCRPDRFGSRDCAGSERK